MLDRTVHARVVGEPVVHVVTLHGVWWSPRDSAYHYSTAQTACGLSVHSDLALAQDEPVTCSACLAAEGGPAVEMAERLLVDARTAVPA